PRANHPGRAVRPDHSADGTAEMGSGEGEATNPTTMVRLWSLQNVFLLWIIRPRILELNKDRCIVRVPLNWITRGRYIHAMYLGTLCMGADIAAGLIAFQLVRERRERVSFIFKDLKG